MSWGDVAAADVVGERFEDRFGRFVDAVYEHRVVPLVGAGVSADRIPQAKDLVGELAPLVDKQCFGDPEGGGDVSFSRVAEIAMRARGAGSVCQALGIAQWETIEPTQAHEYLAMLVADGFIDQIITTNYDCGIERAWDALNIRGGHDQIHVITGARELHHRRGAHGRHWSLYKINGCASRATANPESILLTQSQLDGFQGGHERRWVRDLLRDRARSRTLVLSGFGSDEPQVWHVVRLILEELGALQGTSSSGGAGKDPPGEEENEVPRPWAALYGDRIPFHLLMVLADEAALRGLTPLRDKSGHKFDNVFSSADGRHVDRACSSKLDAGAFWRRVWIDVLKKTLVDPDGPVAQAFVRLATGHRPRGRSDEASWWKLWKAAVEEVARTDGLALASTSRAHSGNHCLAWAGGRYVPATSEPEYWMVGLLLALLEGARPVAAIVQGEPTAGLRRGALVAWVGKAPDNRDSDGTPRQVLFQFEWRLLSELSRDFKKPGKTWNIEFLRADLEKLFRSAIQRHRQREHELRHQRKTRVQP